jgi:hypothetical protein
MAVQETVATLPIARWIEQCSAAEILLNVMVGRMQEITENPPVGGTHGQTIIVGHGIPRLFAMHASNGATPPPIAICLQWHCFLKKMSRF